MHRLITFLGTAMSVLLIAPTACAQTYTFYPAQPRADLPIMVAAVWPYSGNFVATQGYLVSGTSVSIDFVQDGGSFQPNPQFVHASLLIQPLPAGTYTFTIRWVPAPGWSGPPVLPQVFTIVVASAIAEPIPMVSTWALIGLAAAIMLLVWSRGLTPRSTGPAGKRLLSW